MRYFYIFLVFIIALSGFWSFGLKAQEDEKSRFIRFIEEQLSSDNQRISLNGLEGALSSNVTLESITIADKNGIWLSIKRPKLKWNRSSLLLNSQLDIENLEAESIHFIRKPLEDESLPVPEAQPFQIPQLPVAIKLSKLHVPEISFEKAALGVKAKASAKGHLILIDGALETALNIQRLDKAGSVLDLAVDYKPDTEKTAIDIKFIEPENGLLFHALQLEKKPPLSLTIKGEAPLSDLSVNLDLDVDQKNILDGQLSFQKTRQSLEARLTAQGTLSSLFDERYKSFTGANSSLKAQFSFLQNGSMALQEMTLKSGAVNAKASAFILQDGFLQALDVTMKLADSNKAKISLPGGEGTFNKAILTIDYNAALREDWTAKLDVQSFEGRNIAIENFQLSALGLVQNLAQPENRSVTFKIDGGLAQISSEDLGGKKTLGNRVKIAGAGHWLARKPLELDHLTLSGDTININAQGSIDNWAYKGGINLQINDLSTFSPLSERDLSGALIMNVEGGLAPIDGTFDLTFKGKTDALQIGDGFVDKLIFSPANLNGGLSRTENGLVFKHFTLKNDHISFDANGGISSQKADLSALLSLKDISVLNPDSKGDVELSALIKGIEQPFDAHITVAMPKGQVLNRPVENVLFTLDGKVEGNDFDGIISGSGKLNNKPINADGKISYKNNALALKELSADIAGTLLSGTLIGNSKGLFNGNLDLKTNDISDVAALGLIEASGAISGHIDFRSHGVGQSISIMADAGSLGIKDNHIKQAHLEAEIEDAFKKPSINGELTAGNLNISGIKITRLSTKAQTSNYKTNFILNADIEAVGNTKLITRGELIQSADKIDIQLMEFKVTSRQIKALLEKPTTIIIENGMTHIKPTFMKVGRGIVEIEGHIGKTISVEGALDDFPMQIANAFLEKTDATGHLDGAFTISGPSSAPMSHFRLKGIELNTRQLKEKALQPLNLFIEGMLKGRTIHLEKALVQNSQNVSLNASGMIPLHGHGLNVKVDGNLPLALGEVFLVDRGAALTGDIDLNLSGRGSLQNPDFEGLITLNNGLIEDPLSNIRLEDIALLIGLRDQKVTINKGRAKVRGGGRIEMRGDIGLSEAIPANISIKLDKAFYTDGATLKAITSGALTITGSLINQPLIKGELFMNMLEIAVPETFSANSQLLDLTHITPDFQTAQTLSLIDQITPKNATSGNSGNVSLDVVLNTPRRIFVRGRGLDAELGGKIRLTGTTANIVPIGLFSLFRGRLNILGKRLDLSKGEITFAGDLDPVLNFMAQTSASDVEAFVTLSGKASNLKVAFSSTPELPEDEVLARIIFDRGITDLSPVQIARLASAAGELAGVGGLGLVDSFRSTLGLDDLDIISNQDGNAALKAGKYINDNVYLGVEAGSQTEATINLDITEELTARGAIKSDGNTSLGIFFEKDF